MGGGVVPAPPHGDLSPHPQNFESPSTVTLVPPLDLKFSARFARNLLFPFLS